ncbi:MAG TPA: hypothetical protein VIE39_02505 [Thermoanaerobaculia bacterium]|jgi:hypothetical protein
MRYAIPAALTALLAVSCGRPDSRTVLPAPPAPVRTAAAAMAVGFRPPADGVVTDKQIDMFLRVRRAARAERARAGEGSGRSDAESAMVLGVPTAEYDWVRARIVEAMQVLEERRVREGAAKTYEAALASLRETRKRVQDPETLKTLDAQIAALEREAAASARKERLNPALAANVRKVSQRLGDIGPLRP